ncbi:MAG: hypothetical protein IPM92_07310 [Saprospiraceae bacterium]|nr:hypothetical protein [Saprospiraceae bacterium]
MIEFTRKFITICSAWKELLLRNAGNFDAILEQAKRENPWFEKQEIERSLKAICDNYLDETLLQIWLNKYSFEKYDHQKSVGIIAAGNIPFVVFHDLLCALACNYEVYLKLSDKDKVLPEYCLDLLLSNDHDRLLKVHIVSKLPEVDKYIITGSSLTKNYFQSYLKGKPSLIRGHRTSVAVCSGQETDEQWLQLGNDVFSYFGLGCRNVTKLYIPIGFDIRQVLALWDQEFIYLQNVVPYIRNFEYQKAVKLLNRISFLESYVLLLEHSSEFSPPISTLYIEEYSNIQDVLEQLHTHKDQIQCMCASRKYDGIQTIAFGTSQRPGLSDYQDHIDTIEFLLQE